MVDATAARRPALWLVDKPAGPTSHDVVASVRRRLGRGIKVGHTGTLDPFASGLLVVLVGRATRLARFLSSLDKTYVATVRTGFVSATGDPEGPVVAAGEPATANAVRAALPAFLGRQTQRVPAYAAVKVDGERLYRRVRRGEAVERPEREVEVFDLALTEDPGGGEVVLEMRCSAGTYVRQIAADLGEQLGCGAYLTALRRTAVGDLSVDDAVGPAEVGQDGGADLNRVFAHLPVRRLAAGEMRRLLHRVPVEAYGSVGEVPVAMTYEGRIVAVAVPAGGLLRPVVFLEDPR
jgi:tRNA pseudouridine55 synthase